MNSYLDKIKYIISEHISDSNTITNSSLNEEAFYVLHKLRKEVTEMTKKGI